MAHIANDASRAQPQPAAAADETLHLCAGDDLIRSSTPTETPDRARTYTRICRMEDVPRLGARVVRTTTGAAIAIFRTASDEVFALADRCPHRGGPLSQGIVYGERVACPLHNTNVELRSGCAVAPDTGRVQRYAVMLEAGFVLLDLESRADADS